MENKRWFVTVDWCNKGHRGIFCSKEGGSFNSETQELLEVEKWGKVIGNKWQNPEWLKENKNVTN